MWPASSFPISQRSSRFVTVTPCVHGQSASLLIAMVLTCRVRPVELGYQAISTGRREPGPIAEICLQESLFKARPDVPAESLPSHHSSVGSPGQLTLSHITVSTCSHSAPPQPSPHISLPHSPSPCHLYILILSLFLLHHTSVLHLPSLPSFLVFVSFSSHLLIIFYICPFVSFFYIFSASFFFSFYVLSFTDFFFPFISVSFCVLWSFTFFPISVLPYLFSSLFPYFLCFHCSPHSLSFHLISFSFLSSCHLPAIVSCLFLFLTSSPSPFATSSVLCLTMLQA